VTLHPAAITIDVENWFHPELVRERVAADDANHVVRAGTEAILEALARHRVSATFFMLGDVALRNPDLVRRIAGAGHEIGCHGMTHLPLWRLTPEAFRQELREFRALIQAALGADPVVGYRAPTFSLDRTTAWALTVLREEGFTYDSSIFPMQVMLYGVRGAPLGIYRPAGDDLARHDPRGALVEFPVAVGSLAGLRIPVAGGFYLRALPLWLLTAVLDRIARRRPASIYLHPWECAPNLPRVALPWTSALITYFQLDTVGRKLEALLSRYEFLTMRAILEREGHLEATPTRR
jgi:polysaccharide deacetylase family protein (PEP-CTERM system associated)